MPHLQDIRFCSTQAFILRQSTPQFWGKMHVVLSLCCCLKSPPNETAKGRGLAYLNIRPFCEICVLLICWAACSSLTSAPKYQLLSTMTQTQTCEQLLQDFVVKVEISMFIVWRRTRTGNMLTDLYTNISFQTHALCKLHKRDAYIGLTTFYQQNNKVLPANFCFETHLQA